MGGIISTSLPGSFCWDEKLQQWLKSYQEQWSEAQGWKSQWVESHMQKYPQGLMAWEERGLFTSLVFFHSMDQLVEIHFLWTLKKYRRMGHMRSLLSSFIENYKNHRIWLEVGEGNAPALALYKELGFDCVGKRPGYYSSKAGAHLLSL